MTKFKEKFKSMSSKYYFYHRSLYCSDENNELFFVERGEKRLSGGEKITNRKVHTDLFNFRTFIWDLT